MVLLTAAKASSWNHERPSIQIIKLVLFGRRHSRVWRPKLSILNL